MNLIQSSITWEDNNNPAPIYAFEELFDFVEEVYPNCPYAVYAYIFNTIVSINSESTYMTPPNSYEIKKTIGYYYCFDSERLTEYLNSKLSKPKTKSIEIPTFKEFQEVFNKNKYTGKSWDYLNYNIKFVWGFLGSYFVKNKNGNYDDAFIANNEFDMYTKLVESIKNNNL